MAMTTDWSRLMNATGSLSEQRGSERIKYQRCKKSGETAEEYKFRRPIQSDENIKRNRSQSRPMDIEQINADIKRRNEIALHDDLRARFGPRLVKRDGSAMFRFQKK